MLAPLLVAATIAAAYPSELLLPWNDTAGLQACTPYPAPEIPRYQRPVEPAPEVKAGKTEDPPEVAARLREATALTEAGREDEANRKFEELQQWYSQWLRRRINELRRSGLAAARTAGPQPPQEMHDLLHYAKLAGLLGVDPESASSAGFELARVWGTARLGRILPEGLQRARQGGPSVPSQFSEMWRISRDMATMGVGGGNPEGALDILVTYSDARLKQLETPGRQAAGAGAPVPPVELFEARDFARELPRLSTEAFVVSAAERAGAFAEELADTWASVRIRTLREAGEASASDARPDTPIEVEALLHVATLAKDIVPGQADVARTASSSVAYSWIRAHMQRYEPAGRAAAEAGGPDTPEEVRALMQFHRAASCLEAVHPDITNVIRDAAREIGERHLEVYRERLDCAADASALQTLKNLASNLTGYGWGPYDTRGPACNWQGTVTMRIATEVQRDTVAHPTGQPMRIEWAGNESVVIRWDVDGDVAHVTVTGTGKRTEHVRTLVPACNAQDDLREYLMTVRSTPSEVPVKIVNTSGSTYVITLPIPAYVEETRINRKWAASQACPLPGGESSETQSIGGGGYNNVIHGQAEELSGPGGGPAMRLIKGELSLPVSSTPYSRSTTVITWELARRR